MAIEAILVLLVSHTDPTGAATQQPNADYDVAYEAERICAVPFMFVDRRMPISHGGVNAW